MNEHLSTHRRDRRSRTAVHLRTATAALFIALLGSFAFLPGLAHAENIVVSSSPENGSALSTSPTEISIAFVEEIGDVPIVTLECETEIITLPAPTLDATSRVLTVPVETALPRGACIIRWRVNDSDNEPNGDGNISFTVESEPGAGDGSATDGATIGDEAAALPPTTIDTAVETTTSPADTDESTIVSLNDVDTGTGPLWLGRLLSTIGIAVVFGSLVVIAVAWPEGVEYLITIRFIRSAWVLALIGTLLFTSAAAGAVAGESLTSGFNPGAWLDLMSAGWSGRAALFRLIFVIAAVWSAFRPDRVNDPVTQMAALGVPALAVVMIGIGRAEGPLALLGVGLGIAHALAMAIWIGGTVLLFRVVLSGPGEEDLVHAVRGFGRVSVGAIVVTILTGLAQMLRLDGGDLFRIDHGRFLILKVVLVAAMVFIGLSARQVANSRLSRANEMTAPMADRLRRAFGTEAAIGIVVLMVSAWLLSLDPANVGSGPSIDYAIVQQFEIDGDDDGNLELDVTVKLTRDTVGRSGLEVAVDAPAEGLDALEVVFTAPDNPLIGTITQPIPLSAPGRAVLLEAPDALPLTVAGDWLIQVNARTTTGIIQSDQVAITIFNADGTVATTPLTIPPVVTVTIAPTTTTAATDG